jgi:hypothetical protein
MIINQDEWVNPNCTLSNLEQSRIGTNFNFPQNTSRIKSNTSTNYATTGQKVYTKPKNRASDLNDWNFCNPTNFSDKLPQPYRMVVSVLETEILNPVFRKIFQIEEMKNNPSYEGNIKKTGPSGILEMGKISTISKDTLSGNQMLVGDMDGKVSLIDLGRKNLTSKSDVSGAGEPVLPIIDLKCEEIVYGDYTGVVFSAIQKGSPRIKIFMFSSANFQMFHIFTIKLALAVGYDESNLTEDSDISKTAMNCQFTKQAQHCIVTLWNGDILVYPLPTLPV